MSIDYSVLILMNCKYSSRHIYNFIHGAIIGYLDVRYKGMSQDLLFGFKLNTIITHYATSFKNGAFIPKPY